MIATLTRVAWVLVLVIETPLKSSVRDFVLMAVPKRERMALELKLRRKTQIQEGGKQLFHRDGSCTVEHLFGHAQTSGLV
jgi:hypothetical protein